MMKVRIWHLNFIILLGLLSFVAADQLNKEAVVVTDNSYLECQVSELMMECKEIRADLERFSKVQWRDKQQLNDSLEIMRTRYINFGKSVNDFVNSQMDLNMNVDQEKTVLFFDLK